MKGALQFLAGSALLGGAYASSAFLWTYDSQTPKYESNQVSTTSSDTASAIISRRRGMSNERYLQITDESVLTEINQYGGYQQALFGAGTEEIPTKIFVKVSGFQGSVSSFNILPDLWIEDPEQNLLDDFEARSSTKSVCEYDLSLQNTKEVSLIYTYVPTESSCLSKSEISRYPSVLTALSSIPTLAKTPDTKNIETLVRRLKHLQATEGVESTLLILPSTSQLKKSKASRKPELKRAAQAEDPFKLSNDDSSLPSNGNGKKSGTPFDFGAMNSSSNSTHILPKNIPQCFSSVEACENITNSCSGHGSCFKAHTKCYKCGCGKTLVRKNKHVQWGGNACQKKDISAEFVLFVSFGVAMLALISGGIYMLYNMGSQELPSVIGAGVAGPRAQK